MLEKCEFKEFVQHILTTVVLISGFLAITVIVINYFSLPLSKIQFWIGNSTQQSVKKLVPCNKFEVGDVWVKTFPKLTSETAVRLSDVNHDGILDIILGYGTGMSDLFFFLFL